VVAVEQVAAAQEVVRAPVPEQAVPIAVVPVPGMALAARPVVRMPVPQVPMAAPAEVVERLAPMPAGSAGPLAV
jgi:hypothetical protein